MQRLYEPCLYVLYVSLKAYVSLQAYIELYVQSYAECKVMQSAKLCKVQGYAECEIIAFGPALDLGELT